MGAVVGVGLLAKSANHITLQASTAQVCNNSSHSKASNLEPPEGMVFPVAAAVVEEALAVGEHRMSRQAIFQRGQANRVLEVDEVD